MAAILPFAIEVGYEGFLVCMCCVHLYICVFTRTRLGTCTDVCMCTFAHMCIYPNLFRYRCRCMYVRMMCCWRLIMAAILPFAFEIGYEDFSGLQVLCTYVHVHAHAQV